jgi:hypothetical protein
MLSCSKDELPKQERVISNDLFSFERVSSKIYKNKILSWNNNHLSDLTIKSSDDESLSFDYDNLTIASVKNEKGSVIVANELNYDQERNINYGIGYYEYNNEIIGCLVMELKFISEQRVEITYFSPEENNYVTLQFDNEKNEVNVSRKSSDLLKAALEKEGWGKRTMDCVADAYSNHGALSVWTFVQTAFIPETAAAIAIACGIKNL